MGIIWRDDQHGDITSVSTSPNSSKFWSGGEAERGGDRLNASWSEHGWPTSKDLRSATAICYDDSSRTGDWRNGSASDS